MDALKTIQFTDGKSLEIYADDSPDSPRNWDNLGTMVCFHNNYDLGDKDHGYDQRDYTGWSGLQAAIEADNPDCIILPLFLYDHSGLRIKVGSFQGLLPQGHAEFDSGQIGFIFISRDDIEKQYGKHGKRRDKEIAKYLRDEVEIYDQFLSGDVYGFILRGKNCETCDGIGENEDSCWGFYGYDPTKSGMIDHLDEKYQKELKEA